jgi:Nucleoside 2-deoxyribosyltransferase like
MKIIQAPSFEPVEYSKVVFLAGGISNCPNWQSDVLDRLRKYEVITNSPVTICNPRRDNFNTAKAEDSALQIQWEHTYLKLSNIIFFWFPCETLCPITLFEYGKMLVESRHRNLELIVGCHPDYKRKFDVQYQTFLDNPHIKVYDNLTSATTKLIQVIKK